MVAVAYPCPAVSPVRRPSARVLRRRRQLAGAVAVLAAGVVWTLGGVVGWLGSGPLAAPGPDPSRAVPAAVRVYVVQPGDTVWSIARSMQPQGEIRPLVDRLEAEQQGRTLRAGDTLVLP